MKKINIEKLFVTLGLIFGCLFIYIIPPFQSPDEDSHFKKAYSISNGEIFASSNGKIEGLNIPDSMHDYINEKLTIMGDRELKYTYSDFYYDQFLSQDFSSKTLRKVSTSTYTPIAHLIPAIGILFGKLLAPILIGVSPSTAYLLQFARFFCLLSYLIIGYFAIKKTPIFKKSFFTILLLPMSIYLGSMVTYDNLLLSLSLLAIAVILDLIYNKKSKFNKYHIIIFTIIGYILLNIKTVYFPLLGLLIFVPKDKFKDKENKNKIKAYGFIILLILLFTILLKIPNMFLDVEQTSSLYSKQISYIFSHPLSYLKILLTNIHDEFWTQIYWMTGNFGLLDTYLPPLFTFITIINLLISFMADGIVEKIKINKWIKILCGLILIVSLAAMYTAMYIYWTVDIYGIVGGLDITGIQGRYFLPLLICLPLLLSTKCFNKQTKIVDFSKNYFEKSIVLTTICLIVSIIVSLTRFWM